MKKDSFTFSDKLKKSKTLPLSKRIPSRVGGEVKAKRTFFDRAQRDLPFIIVAALALLLLPFLSRETVDIDTPSVVWGGDDGGAITEGIDLGEGNGIGDEMAMSSFRNPLDLIIRHGESDSTSKDTLETPYSSEDSDSSSYGESSRSTYGSEEYSSSPATSRYGKTVKRSVRNSINRVPTALGALRTSATIDPGAGNSGIGHTMALGSRAKDGAPRVQGPGVRPVALQPLVASGKGRDLTGGDALYAEAARSIGAMNRPGAKQAVLEAQLKDVDGKPLGDTKGTGAAAAAGKGPAAGGPSNNWSHTNQRPWWWDMMKERSQMRWMLWHYNWEKMLSDSLIKLTAGLASCLITGSNDFAVNKFLGEAGSSRDIPCCTTSSGARFCADDVAEFSTSTSGSGDGKEEQNNAIISLSKMCGENAVWSVKEDITARKSALDVRLRCLGLKLSELKAAVETNYAVACAEIDSTPMALTVNVSRNGKVKPKKLEKMGYYIVAEKARTGKIINHTQEGHMEQCDTARVIFIDKLPTYGGRITIDNDRILKDYPDYRIKKVVVYKVGSKKKNSDNGLSDATEEYNKMLTYTSEQQTKYNKKHGKNAYEKKIHELQEELAKQTDLYSGRELNESKEGVEYADPLKTVKSEGYFTEQEEIDTTISEKEYESAFTLLRGRIKNGECVTEDFVRYQFKPWKGKLNQVQVCPVAPKLLDVKIENGMIRRAKCFSTATTDYKVRQLVAGEEYPFQADIIEPTRRVLAFVVERYNTPQGYKDWQLVDVFDTHSKDVKLSEEKFLHKEGEHTFTGKVVVGVNGDNKEVGQDAIPGEGKIIWIATDDLYGKASPIVSGASVNISDLFLSREPKQVAVCNYSWGCEKVRGQDICSPKDECCLGEDGKAYEATYLDEYIAGVPFKTKKLCENRFNYTQEQLARLQPCARLCEQSDGRYNVIDYNVTISKEYASQGGVDTTDCRFCNLSETKRATGPGLVCVDPLKSNEYCPCIKVDNPITPKQTPIPGTLYIRSEVYPDNPQVEELPVTPICYKRAIATGNIFVRNPDGTAGVRVDPDGDIVTMLLRHTPEEQAQLCPFCSDDIGDVCIDPLEGNEPCPCVKVDNPRTPGVSNPLFVRSDVTTVTPRSIMLPVTPICYKKAIALGNIYVRNPDGTAGNRVDPDKDVVTMLLSKSKDVQDALCPYCNDEPGEEPAQGGPRTLYDDSVPCQITLAGDYFINASYVPRREFITDEVLEGIYNHLKNCGDLVIEGFASDTMTVGEESQFPPKNSPEAKERNNYRLAFDRALEISKLARGVWEKHGEIITMDLSDKQEVKSMRKKMKNGSVQEVSVGVIGNTNYTGANSGTPEKSLPRSRAQVSNPVKSDATVTFKLISYGSYYNEAGARPTQNLSPAERRAWLDKEMQDRKVVLRGTK